MVVQGQPFQAISLQTSRPWKLFLVRLGKVDGPTATVLWTTDVEIQTAHSRHFLLVPAQTAQSLIHVQMVAAIVLPLLLLLH